MKYLNIIILFLVAALIQLLFNANQCHWLQPFLIALIFLYYTEDNPWVYYSFAALAGLFLDSFSASFGLYTLTFLLVIAVVSGLQLTTFTSKNTGTIILLTIIGFAIFWLIIWLLQFAFMEGLYSFPMIEIWQIIKFYFINVFITIFIYILYFNLWLKRHESR